MIYLRPTPQSKPVKYSEVVEKAGLVTQPKYSIALYTCRAGAKQGPPGPQGEPYLYDTIIASCSDELTPLFVDLITPCTTFRAPFPMDIAQVRISLTTAGEGADVIVDLKMNGTSIFSEYLHIDPLSRTSVGATTQAVIVITDVPDDAEFLPFIRQVGSTVAGSGLKIAVTGTKKVA